MINEEGPIKKIQDTPEVGVLVLKCDNISYIVKMHCFILKNLRPYSQAHLKQTEGIVIIS